MTGKRFALLIAASALVPILGAFGVSKYYWGYYVAPPEISLSRDSVKSIESVSGINENRQTGLIEVRWVDTSAEEMKRKMALAGQSLDLAVWNRLLIKISTEELIPEKDEPISSGEARLIIDKIKSLGILLEGEEGYKWTKHLNGYIAKGEDSAGVGIIYATLWGGEMSNDHYPNYDLLFKVSGKGGLELIEKNVYFEDIAGLEGVRVKSIMIIFLFPWFLMVLLAIPVFLLWRAFVINRIVKPTPAP